MIDRVSPSGFVAHSLRRVRRDFHLPAVWSLLAVLRALRREGLAAGLSELRFGWCSLRRGWRRASMTSELEPLRFAASEAPRVSIIVPVHNQWLHTFNCLRSILRSGSDTSYEIIIVDNASTDRTGEVLDHLENVRVLRFDDNQGFLEGCNRGLEVARGEAVLFLNNDTVVTPGWLDSLIRVLDENPECGGVGPKLLFPNGRLQEAGSIV